MVKNKTCPQCDFHGSVQKYFGYRNAELTIAQSWCLDCRTDPAKKAEAVPRKKTDKAKAKQELPTGMAALRRMYRSETGDTKLRSVEYMRKTLGG